MLILGWDTATPATAVALLDTDTARLCEARHDPGPDERAGHTTQLLGLVERVRGRTGWNRVDRLGVGTGPGSFTGLRIGLASARALALARELPLVGVPTLRALALAADDAAVYAPENRAPELVLAVVSARRREAFIAAYAAGGAEVAPAQAVAAERLGETVARLPAAPLAVGDGAVRFRVQLEAAGAVVPEDPSPLHRVSGAWICRLAAVAPETPAAMVLPRYGRPPDAIPRRRPA